MCVNTLYCYSLHYYNSAAKYIVTDGPVGLTHYIVTVYIITILLQNIL